MPRCDHGVLTSVDAVTQMYTPASLADVPGDLLCKNMEVSLEKELQNYKIQTHEHVFLGSLNLIKKRSKPCHIPALPSAKATPGSAHYHSMTLVEGLLNNFLNEDI